MALTGLTKVTNIGINTTTIPTLGGSRNTGVVTATTFVGDGSGLSNVTGSGSGVIVRDGGSLVGTAGTINFGTNLNVSAISAGIVTVTNAASATALTNLSDVTVTSASNGQILKHNGSVFVNTAETTYSQSSVASGSNINLRLTDSDGTNDDILITAGSNITFSSVSANGFTIAASGGGGGGGGISNVVEDTTPQLGGILDLNNNFISGSGGINVSGVTTSTSFVGSLTGNVTGNADTATNSTNSSHVLVTDNESTDENNLIPFVENAQTSTGNHGLEMDGDFTYNPSTGNLTATKFTGSGVALTGVVTSIVAGSNITLTGGPTGIVTIAAAGGGSGITDVIQDTTPQLGGSLDLNNKFITGSGGINVTGVITATTFVGNGDFVDLDVDGHTELDNTNIVGMVTITNSSSGIALKLIDASSKQFAAGGGGGGSPFAGSFTGHDFRIQVGGLQNAIFKYVADAKGTFELGPSSGIGITFHGYTGNAKFAGITTSSGGFVGNLTGNADTATTATNVTVADESSDTSCNVLFTTAATGNLPPKSGTNLTFNSSSGALTAGSFVKSGGTSSQFLKADGSVDGSTYLTSGSYLENVVEDTTPQLGGNLDLNSKNITGTGNAQIVGVITATSAVPTWTLGASGTDHYTFTGNGFTSATNDPDIYLVRGQRYAFLNNSGGNHPFQIQSDANSTAYNTGVTNNNATSGYITFNVPMSAPAHLYYKCSNHPNMLGNIYIVGQHLANGTNNRVLTASGAYGMNGEQFLTFDGTTLDVTGNYSVKNPSDASYITHTFSSNFAKLDIRGTNIANSYHYLLSYGAGHGSADDFHMVNKTTNGALAFRTGSTTDERLRIGSDGTSTFDVGAPSSSNKVIGRFQAQSSRQLDIVWHDTGSLMGFDTPGNHAYIFKCNGNERLRLANDGELFVGASYHGYANRSTLLSVTGPYQDPTGVWTQVGVYSDDGYAANKGGTIGFGGQDGSTPQQQFAAIKGAKANGTSGDYEGYMAFFIRPNGSVSSEQLRIAADGFVSFGGDADLGFIRTGTNTLQCKTNGQLCTEFSANQRVRMPQVYSTNGSNMRDVQIESDGTLCAGNTSIRAAKKNIVSQTDVSWLYNLNPVTFNYRKHTVHPTTGVNTYSEETLDVTSYGLIAEEVESVKKDFCFYNGSDLTGVDYKSLITPLLKALQQQKAEIDALKTRVATLEGS